MGAWEEVHKKLVTRSMFNDISGNLYSHTPVLGNVILMSDRFSFPHY